MERTTVVEPPAGGSHGPEPTEDDPTAGNALCGARRKPAQIEADRERGIDEPWPYCRNRAGKGTPHTGTGRCSNHGGSTSSHRTHARLRLAELVGPAIGTLARVMADPEASDHSKVRAAEAILDRAGWPRRLDVNVDDARESLVERLVLLQASDDVTS